MIVLILEFLQTGNVVCQYGAVALGKAIVVGGLTDRIDYVVKNTVVPAALIEVGLHFGKFLFGTLQAFAFPVGGAVGTPDMVQIRSYVHENVSAPVLGAKTLVAVVVPVLGNGGKG